MKEEQLLQEYQGHLNLLKMKKINNGRCRSRSNNLADKTRHSVWHCQPAAANVKRPPKPNKAGNSGTSKTKIERK